jgi:hypothetical protein
MKFAELTEQIAMDEGKKVAVNIAQIKEITKLTLKILADLPLSEVAKLITPHKKK